MSVRNLLVLPVLLLSHLPGWGQAPAPDFADGFKRLAALGMPALDAKATWIKHPAADADYEIRALTKSVKGNAWLIPTPDGKPNVIPLGGVEPVTADPSEKPVTAEPGPPQDLTKDVEAITAALDKLAAKLDPDEFAYRSRDPGFGKFLLFATQLYQNGHPELANPLALAVFKVFPSREAAVDAAIDLLAKPLYQQATGAFFTSGDWAAYHQALVALSKRFPRGWSNHDAVALLLPQLAKQAAGAKAPAIALPDIALDPRALECIRQLGDKAATQASPAEARGGSSALRRRMQMRYDSIGASYSPTPLWLINDDPEAAKNPSPLARLAALKMAALPALAALISDPFLTRFPNPGSSSGFYSSSHDDNDDRTILLYASLSRPATRGELATQLLTATLPDSQNELNQANPEALREIALTFWKEHKTATREELAAVFLRDGSRNQAEQAASILATSSDPKAHQAFEAHVLAADPAIALYQYVQTYLRARKAAAKPFFVAYAKLVRSQAPATATDDDLSYERSGEVTRAGGPEKILKQLETLISGQSPRTLAVEIAKGKPADAGAAINSLTSMLADATPIKHLHALLEGANAATDAIIRARFLQATYDIEWGNDPTDEDPSKDTPAAERKVSEPEAAVWRKLIADTRNIPSGFSPVNRFKQVQTSEKITVAELAAFALEQTLNSDIYMTATEASPILGKSANAILVEQATARLAGKPLPVLPDASKIARNRLAEIVAEAAKKSATEVHPYLASLTPDERAAWLEWLEDPGDLPVPASVKSLQQVIIGRLPDNECPFPPDAKGPGAIAVGLNVTAENLTKQIESLAAAIDQHSRTIISIAPASFGPGLEVRVGLIPLLAQPAKRGTSPDMADEDEEYVPNGAAIFAQSIGTLDANESATGTVMVGLESPEVSSEAIWLVQDGKATLQQPAEPEAEQRHPFAATVKKVLEADERTQFFLYIQFLSRADAAKFKAASKDPSTPTEDEE